MFLCRLLFVIRPGGSKLAILCIRNLRGTVHSMAQFLQKFLSTMIKMIIVLLLELEVVLKWMDCGRNLDVCNLFSLGFLYGR